MTEGALTNGTHNVTHGFEYQWFTHELPAQFFGGDASDRTIKEAGDYFIEKVNSVLVFPYSIYAENFRIKEPYKFISGSLERLTEILSWARFVCEGIKNKARTERQKLRQPSYDDQMRKFERRADF